MDVSLPSYEAAMRNAREYLSRRDLSSQDEVPLYFAWERLYAAANANLSTDFLLETNVERRARQQARLAPRRGLPPPLFTSFDKLNRRSAQASAFLRSGSSSDVAIEMMARRYRREAEKLRSSREELVMGSLDGAGKRLKKGKRRQKSPEEEVEELLEAYEHSKVLPEDKLRASLTGKSKLETNSKSNGLEVDTIAAKAAELRKSSFSKPKPETPPSFSNVANVAAFAAKVSDWKMPSDIDVSSPTSKLLQKKTASTSAKRVSEANEIRRSTPTDDAEGDMTFDTSLDSSGFDEDSVDSETLREVGASSASQTGRRLTKRVGAVDAKTKVNQEQKPTKTSLNGKRAEDFSRTAADADKNLPIGHEFPAQGHGDLANPSEFQQKLARLSHAVGDMQVKIQGKQIEVTFKGSLDETNTAEGQHGEALKSEIDLESAHTSVARKVFETRNDEENDEEELEGGAQQWAQAETVARSTTNLPRKQSSVRFADMESVDGSDDHNEDDHLNDNEANEEEDESYYRRNTSDAQEDNTRQNRSSTRSSARYSTITRSTAETEPVSDEEFSDEEEEMRTQRSSSQRQDKSDQDQELDDQDETRDADDFQDSHQTRTNEDEAVRDESEMLHQSSSGRHHTDEIKREQNVHTAKAGSAPAKRREIQQSLENVGSSLSTPNATRLDEKPVSSNRSSLVDNDEAPNSEGQDSRPSSSRSRRSDVYPRDESVRSSRSDSVATIEERRDPPSQYFHGRVESTHHGLAQDVTRRKRPEEIISSQDGFEVFKDQITPQQRDPRRQKLNRDISRTNGVRHRTRQEADAPRSRKDRDHSTYDDENGVGTAMDEEFASRDENCSSRKRNSDRSRENFDSRHTDFRRTPNAKSSTSSSARERSSYHEMQNKNRSGLDGPRRSRKQLEELIDDELYSDEDFSDGPDTPYRRPQIQQHRHDSNRKQSWVSDGSRESSTRKGRKHLSSRAMSRQKRSHSKRRSYSPESSADSEVMNSSDSDSHEEVGSDERYRKDQRTRVNYSTRNHEEPSRSSRKSTHKQSSRDHHFIPAMKYPPKIIKPEIRLSKTKSESREKEVVRKLRKLPEGIVWPPGMEEECIARLGLDGHHPIAPPGLEHLVTEEQWGDYWTWLHWYSSWQMWYMKNGKKPKRKSNKEKRRHSDPYAFQDDEGEHHDEHSRGNANWWVDVGPDKYHRRRSRVD